MEKFTLCYKTDRVTNIGTYDSLEEAKAVIDDLTEDAIPTNSEKKGVKFQVWEWPECTVVYSTPRYEINTVKDL